MNLNKIFYLRKKFHYLSDENSGYLSNDAGQSFLEFILLLLVLISLSMGMVGGFNNTVAKQWHALVKVISLPNNTNDFKL